MLIVKCDFCNKKITTKQNKTNEPQAFRLEENICKECNKKDLSRLWSKEQPNLKEKWKIIEQEKVKFFKNLLKHQKEVWYVEQKKEFFGSFFVEEKN